MKNVPDAFKSVVLSGKGFAMCLMHTMRCSTRRDKHMDLDDKATEYMMGFHTVLVVVKDKTLTVIDSGDYELQAAADAVLQACGVPPGSKFETQLVTARIQDTVELFNNAAVKFYTTAVTQQEIEIAPEILWLGHKGSRDFVGYCGGFSMVTAEWLIHCHQNNLTSRFDIATLAKSILWSGYNPVKLYIMVRLYLRAHPFGFFTKTKRSPKPVKSKNKQDGGGDDELTADAVRILKAMEKETPDPTPAEWMVCPSY